MSNEEIKDGRVREIDFWKQIKLVHSFIIEQDRHKITAFELSRLSVINLFAFNHYEPVALVITNQEIGLRC